MGEFIGPVISFNIPIVDFGLIKAGSVGHIKIELKNESDTEAEILFKEDGSFGSFEGNIFVIEYVKTVLY